MSTLTRPTKENFSTWLTTFPSLFQKSLEASWDRLYDRLKEAQFHRAELETISVLRYATSSGKRLRPLLVALSFFTVKQKREGKEAVVTDREERLLLGLCRALELVHSYSLVHDDLPAMDNDRYRRGQLTVHARFGEAQGILTGDCLLNCAYEELFQLLGEEGDSSWRERLLQAGRDLSHGAGIFGMISGQVMDLYGEEAKLTEKQVRDMVLRKTCALFVAAVSMGADLAGASKEQKACLARFAEKWGMAFQLQDDLLDQEDDDRIHKQTLLSGKSQEEAEEYIRQLNEQALQQITSAFDPTIFQLFMEKLLHRNY